MRRFQKKMILDMLETICEASVRRMYADCQCGAIKLGEFIEALEGGETRTVELLERYCELLYKVDCGGQDDGALEKSIHEIERSVCEEFKDKMEVVFISYNAAMADSLESIYLAAKADKSCDAYFIAVPYFERNPDFSLGKFIYSNEHGPNIEMTDYLTYNLAARQPDVIFTNNPYDDNNRVTCVHPDYFTSQLRHHTDLLCYVPYFLPLESDSDHLVKIIASLPCDLIVAVSDRDKQLYMNQNPRADVITFGSPKTDVLLSAIRQKPPMAREWAEKMSAIKAKKIVVLISSLGYLIEHREVYLDRLEDYVSAIEAQKDFMLVFRPHPLMYATLHSMLPAYCDRYMTLLARIEMIGLVDKSEDYIPTLINADVFVGETYSTLARMFALTGKPMFEMSIETGSDDTTPNGGLLKGSYQDSQQLSISKFLEQYYQGEIPTYSEEQVSYAQSLYANCDGTVGEKIYQYIKNKLGESDDG